MTNVSKFNKFLDFALKLEPKVQFTCNVVVWKYI